MCTMLMMRTNKRTHTQRSWFTHTVQRASTFFSIYMYSDQGSILFFQGYAHFIRWSCDGGDIFSFRSTDKPGGSNCDKIREVSDFMRIIFVGVPSTMRHFLECLWVYVVLQYKRTHNIRRRRRQINKNKNINKLPRAFCFLRPPLLAHTSCMYVFLRAHSKHPSTCPRG